MKLKDALKKFNFIKRLDVSDIVAARLANFLAGVLKGSTEEFLTPLARKNDPIEVLVDWDIIFKSKAHLINHTLSILELSNRSKFGSRSYARPWSERVDSLKESYIQDKSFSPIYHFDDGPGCLRPTNREEAFKRLKSSTSAGLPYMTKKAKAIPHLLEHFDVVYDRKDPCVVVTRTAESKKTRNAWSFPIADTFYENFYYVPLLEYQKTLHWRSSLLHPDITTERITKMILDARMAGKVLLSVDFTAFDASIRYQYIIKAFDYIKSCFAPIFHPVLDQLH